MTTSTETLLERLHAHRTLAPVPRAELEWLVAHGTIQHFATGDHVARKGEPVHGMYVILKGRLSHFTDQGGSWRKVMDWREGDVTGQLPYSRLEKAPGNTVIDEPTEALVIPKEHVGDLPVACPTVTTALVHTMLDRVRVFKSSDLQLEKLASLGKLAAGLAHELNNPASAAARSAQLLSAALEESEQASRALGATRLSASEQAALDRVGDLCVDTPAMSVRTPLERADREELIADWLAQHRVDESFAGALADTDVKIETLTELAGALTGEQLAPALRWLAAGCFVRGLARDIDKASTRVHELVSAVKGFTYMDRATVPEPVDVRKGLTDTLSVLSAKARAKAASVTIDVAPDLPQVKGFGGELNQVWANLIDNALDAVANGGRITVAAAREGASVVVRVSDDGPGIPAEVRSRIFDPFFTTKPVGKGTGLGLDIARRLVDRHAGRIELDSQPGRTEFRVTLPVVDVS